MSSDKKLHWLPPPPPFQLSYYVSKAYVSDSDTVLLHRHLQQLLAIFKPKLLPGIYLYPTESFIQTKSTVIANSLNKNSGQTFHAQFPVPGRNLDQICIIWKSKVHTNQ